MNSATRRDVTTSNHHDVTAALDDDVTTAIDNATNINTVGSGVTNITSNHDVSSMITIGDDALCREPLAAGRLVRLPGPTLAPRHGYCLLVPDTAVLSRPVRRVRDWLLEMAGS